MPLRLRAEALQRDPEAPGIRGAPAQGGRPGPLYGAAL